MGQFLNFLKSFFGGVWHFLLDYIHAAIPEATAVIMKDLLPIADQEVAIVNDSQMSGAQKRDAAFAAIQGKLASIGLEVAGHLVYLAIEMAVTKLKSVPDGNTGILPGGVQSTPAPDVAATQ